MVRPKRAATIALITSFLGGVTPNASAAEKWVELAPHVDHYRTTYKHRGRPAGVRIDAIRIDPKKIDVRLVDPVKISIGEQGVVVKNFTGPTLRSVLPLPRLTAAISGGFITSYAFPQPLGLARISSTELAPMTKARLLSGVLCVEPKGKVRILRAADSAVSRCRDALQSGPLVVEAMERNGIGLNEKPESAAARTVVCTDDDEVIFIYAEVTLLWDLAEILRLDDEDGGVGCDVALNLSGDINAGLAWTQGSEMEYRGSIDAVLATAIVATRR